MTWIRRTFGRPYAHRNEPDQLIWLRIDECIKGDGTGAYLDLRAIETEDLKWLTSSLRVRSYGKTYGRAFRKIAQMIADYVHAHAVDHLAALVDPPPTKPVKITGKTSRDRAMEKIKRKYQL